MALLIGNYHFSGQCGCNTGTCYWLAFFIFNGTTDFKFNTGILCINTNTALQQQNSPAQIAANDAFATSRYNRYDPMSPDYAFGIPNGDASKLNPYTGLTTSLAGVPTIRTAMPRMAVG